MSDIFFTSMLPKLISLISIGSKSSQATFLLFYTVSENIMNCFLFGHGCTKRMLFYYGLF